MITLKQEISKETVQRKPYSLNYVRERFKTKAVCIKAVEENPWSLEFVPDQCKIQEMCEKTVREDSYSLMHVSNLVCKKSK